MTKEDSDRVGPTDRGYVSISTDDAGLSTVEVALAPGAEPFAYHYRAILDADDVGLLGYDGRRWTEQPVEVFRTASDRHVHLARISAPEHR